MWNKNGVTIYLNYITTTSKSVEDYLICDCNEYKDEFIICSKGGIYYINKVTKDISVSYGHDDYRWSLGKVTKFQTLNMSCRLKKV